MKHKHAGLIKLWADGAEIEFQDVGGDWRISRNPEWLINLEYRVKPKPNKELLVTMAFEHALQEPLIASMFLYENNANPNVKFTFDGETGEFLKVEKL